MKLNAQTTALRLLSDNPDNQMFLSTVSIGGTVVLDFFKNEFKSMLPLFRQRIQYISSPFFNAYLKAEGKVLKILLHEPIKQSGTLITPNGSETTLTTFYNLETKCTEKGLIMNGRLLMLGKYKQDQYPYVVFYGHIVGNDVKSFQRLEEIDQDYTVNDHANMILGLILFTKYCDVQTKLIPAGRETMHRLQRYVNHTKLPIEILDATWFTTLVRSGAFTVGESTGGFFRWHAVGPGRSERKLIWVNPYQKQGYTRKAKVLLHRPDSPN